MSFGDAFKRPFQDFKSLLIGIVIMLIPIVNFIGFGYLVQCAKTVTRRNYKLPPWQGWLDLFASGIIMLVIGVIYLIPAIIIGLLASLSLLRELPSMIGTGINLVTIVSMSATAGIGIIVAAIVSLIGLFVGSAAVVRYADTGKLSAAFELNAIFKKAFTGTFFAAWLIGMIYTCILSVILGMIPFIGSAIALFIGGVTSITLVAEAYSKA